MKVHKKQLSGILANAALLFMCLTYMAAPALAQSGDSDERWDKDALKGLPSPASTMREWCRLHPDAAYCVADRSFPEGSLDLSKPDGMGVIGMSSGSVWPELQVPIPIKGGQHLKARMEIMDKITGFQDPQVGPYPLTSNMAAVVMATSAQLEVAAESSPQYATERAKAEQDEANSTAADSNANLTRMNAGSAIDYVGNYLFNFTVDEGNKWNRCRNELFLPMAILILLPGAVLAQVKAIVAAGTPVIGGREDVTSPFEGILRSIIAIFMIPATYLFINYGIDLANSITYTIADEYQRIFGSSMYEDAMCLEVRAFPVRNVSENKGYTPNQTATMGMLGNSPGVSGGGPTPFAEFEGKNVEVKLLDPCAGLNNVPADRTNESVDYEVHAQRNIYNTANAGLAMSWNILCAFQMAFLYYLWFAGPVVAALWVYPMGQLRAALPNWCTGVATICFWSLFWNTVILLMACLRGCDETGTMMATALNFLATASVKSAFDFGGLTREAAGQISSIAKGAASAATSAGHGKSGSAGGQQGGHHGAGHPVHGAGVGAGAGVAGAAGADGSHGTHGSHGSGGHQHVPGMVGDGTARGIDAIAMRMDAQGGHGMRSVSPEHFPLPPTSHGGFTQASYNPNESMPFMARVPSSDGGSITVDDGGVGGSGGVSGDAGLQAAFHGLTLNQGDNVSVTPMHMNAAQLHTLMHPQGKDGAIDPAARHLAEQVAAAGAVKFDGPNGMSSIMSAGALAAGNLPADVADVMQQYDAGDTSVVVDVDQFTTAAATAGAGTSGTTTAAVNGDAPPPVATAANARSVVESGAASGVPLSGTAGGNAGTADRQAEVVQHMREAAAANREAATVQAQQSRDAAITSATAEAKANAQAQAAAAGTTSGAVGGTFGANAVPGTTVAGNAGVGAGASDTTVVQQFAKDIAGTMWTSSATGGSDTVAPATRSIMSDLAAPSAAGATLGAIAASAAANPSVGGAAPITTAATGGTGDNTLARQSNIPTVGNEIAKIGEAQKEAMLQDHAKAAARQVQNETDVRAGSPLQANVAPGTVPMVGHAAASANNLNVAGAAPVIAAGSAGATTGGSGTDGRNAPVNSLAAAENAKTGALIAGDSPFKSASASGTDTTISVNASGTVGTGNTTMAAASLDAGARGIVYDTTTAGTAGGAAPITVAGNATGPAGNAATGGNADQPKANIVGDAAAMRMAGHEAEFLKNSADATVSTQRSSFGGTEYTAGSTLQSSIGKTADGTVTTPSSVGSAPGTVEHRALQAPGNVDNAAPIVVAANNAGTTFGGSVGAGNATGGTAETQNSAFMKQELQSFGRDIAGATPFSAPDRSIGGAAITPTAGGNATVETASLTNHAGVNPAGGSTTVGAAGSVDAPQYGKNSVVETTGAAPVSQPGQYTVAGGTNPQGTTVGSAGVIDGNAGVVGKAAFDRMGDHQEKFLQGQERQVGETVSNSFGGRSYQANATLQEGVTNAPMSAATNKLADAGNAAGAANVGGTVEQRAMQSSASAGVGAAPIVAASAPSGTTFGGAPNASASGGDSQNSAFMKQELEKFGQTIAGPTPFTTADRSMGGASLTPATGGEPVRAPGESIQLSKGASADLSGAAPLPSPGTVPGSAGTASGVGNAGAAPVNYTTDYTTGSPSTNNAAPIVGGSIPGAGQTGNAGTGDSANNRMAGIVGGAANAEMERQKQEWIGQRADQAAERERNNFGGIAEQAGRTLQGHVGGVPSAAPLTGSTERAQQAPQFFDNASAVQPRANMPATGSPDAQAAAGHPVVGQPVPAAVPAGAQNIAAGQPSNVDSGNFAKSAANTNAVDSPMAQYLEQFGKNLAGPTPFTGGSDSVQTNSGGSSAGISGTTYGGGAENSGLSKAAYTENAGSGAPLPGANAFTGGSGPVSGSNPAYSAPGAQPLPTGQGAPLPGSPAPSNSTMPAGSSAFQGTTAFQSGAATPNAGSPTSPNTGIVGAAAAGEMDRQKNEWVNQRAQDAALTQRNSFGGTAEVAGRALQDNVGAYSGAPSPSAQGMPSSPDRPIASTPSYDNSGSSQYVARDSAGQFAGRAEAVPGSAPQSNGYVVTPDTGTAGSAHPGHAANGTNNVQAENGAQPANAPQATNGMFKEQLERFGTDLAGASPFTGQHGQGASITNVTQQLTDPSNVNTTGPAIMPAAPRSALSQALGHAASNPAGQPTVVAPGILDAKRPNSAAQESKFGAVARDREEALDSVKGKSAKRPGASAGPESDKNKPADSPSNKPSSKLGSALGRAVSTGQAGKQPPVAGKAGNGQPAGAVPVASNAQSRNVKDPMGSVAVGTTLRRWKQSNKMTPEEIEAMEKLGSIIDE